MQARRLSTHRPYIWLASYPKSGNTWLRLLLAHLLDKQHNRERLNPHNVLNPYIASARNLFDETLQLDSSELPHEHVANLRPLLYRTLAEKTLEPLFTKTHDALTLANGSYLFPPEVTHAAIYIVRNPFDVAVSYFHYTQDKSLDTIVDNLCRSNHYIGKDSSGQLRQQLGGWSNHYCSWTKQSAIAVKTIRYEDLLQDTAASLTQVAAYLGLAEASSPEKIDYAVTACEFNKLQQAEKQSINEGNSVNGNPFFRSGTIGSWKNILTPEHVQMIVHHHRTTMTELGYLDEKGEITCQ